MFQTRSIMFQTGSLLLQLVYIQGRYMVTT